MAIVRCDGDACSMVVSHTRCALLGWQAGWERVGWRIGSRTVVVLVAFVAKISVALWGAVCGKFLVALLATPLLDTQRAAVPGVRFWLDRAVTVVTVVLRAVVCGLAGPCDSVGWHAFFSEHAILA